MAATLSRVDDRPTGLDTPGAPVTDNRPVYLAWGSAWAVGYGAMALDGGSTPVLDLPSLVAPALLGLGLLGAAVVVVRDALDRPSLGDDLAWEETPEPVGV